MAPARKAKKSISKKSWPKIDINELVSLGKDLIFNPQYTWVIAVLLFVTEIFVNVLVINKVNCK